jgi:hypothetical protein
MPRSLPRVMRNSSWLMLVRMMRGGFSRISCSLIRSSYGAMATSFSSLYFGNL